jgi:imidazolonepropionase-like amidohydrolase
MTRFSSMAPPSAGRIVFISTRFWTLLRGGAFALAAVLGSAALGLAATPRVHAIVGARIVTAPGQVIERGTVVIRDGLIEAVGASVTPPADARIWDAKGLTVYPGLIDPFAAPPTDASETAPAAPRGGTTPSDPEGARHELPSVTPERRVVETDGLDDKGREAMRAAGFAAVNLVPPSGIIRGQSAVMGLGDGAPNTNLVRADAVQVMSIETDRNGYPGSRMGAVAVLRQSFLDAAWYRDARTAYARAPVGTERPEFNLAWDALQGVLEGRQSVFLRVDDMLGVLTAAAIGREAGVTPVVVGAGDSYKRVTEIAATGVSLIVPVRYPETPDVSDPEDALEVPTELLRYWQDAPGNGSALSRHGVRFAFTANGLEKAKDFRDRVRQAIERGLAPDAALASVTTVPAAMLGVSNRLGSIAPGKIANLTVTSGDLFARGSAVREVWVDGNRYEVEAPGEGFAGRWKIDGREGTTLIVKAEHDTSVRMITGADTTKATEAKIADKKLTFLIGGTEPARFEFVREAAGLTGTRTDATKATQALSGVRLPDAEEPAKPEPPLVPAPAVAGNSEPWRMPVPERPAALLVRNATIWTAGPQGILDAADMLVRDGKIVAVGRGLQAPRGAMVIDGTGKHVAPGIIDEHSHAAILGGVNECTNINTAEVRIRDVINSESINIYRQLAGGTTIMHLLHGSCNAIGGQCAVIKNRWGAPPDQLLMKEAAPTIKFALGENPKRSNFRIPSNPNRYPGTRGGVEQVYRDAFSRALDYRAAWNEYRAKQRRIPPPRDLNSEALLEVLDGKRFVTCHSYRQDEILMMMRVAEEFGFRINTFTHILEGYKIADEIAAHGASAAGFTDWWAYKYEVIDAIPWNEAIMWDRGVNVGFNSDDAELARRLNQEAAKAVKYGNVPPATAIKFVTLNPAKMLHIEDHVGSLEKGKDADFSIWTGSPISPGSTCEQTWVDGRKYFDREADLAGRPALEAERNALIARAKELKKNGGAGKNGKNGDSFLYWQDADLGGNDCGADGEYGIEARARNAEEGGR